jgi:hypothetical protein
LAAAVLASVALTAQLMLPHFCHLDLSLVSDAQEMRLRGELMDLVNGPPRIDHLDSSDVADTVALVRDSLVATAKSLDGVLQFAGLLLSNPALVAIAATRESAVRRCGAARAGTRPVPASRTGQPGQCSEGARLPSRHASC